MHISNANNSINSHFGRWQRHKTTRNELNDSTKKATHTHSIIIRHDKTEPNRTKQKKKIAPIPMLFGVNYFVVFSSVSAFIRTTSSRMLVACVRQMQMPNKKREHVCRARQSLWPLIFALVIVAFCCFSCDTLSVMFSIFGCMENIRLTCLLRSKSFVHLGAAVWMAWEDCQSAHCSRRTARVWFVMFSLVFFFSLCRVVPILKVSFARTLFPTNAQTAIVCMCVCVSQKHCNYFH